MFDLVAVGGAKFERKNRRCATCWEAVVPRERLQCGAVSSRLRVYVWLLQPNKTHPIKLPLMMRLPDHISCKKMQSNRIEGLQCRPPKPLPLPPSRSIGHSLPRLECHRLHPFPLSIPCLHNWKECRILQNANGNPQR